MREKQAWLATSGKLHSSSTPKLHDTKGGFLNRMHGGNKHGEGSDGGRIRCMDTNEFCKISWTRGNSDSRA